MKKLQKELLNSETTSFILTKNQKKPDTVFLAIDKDKLFSDAEWEDVTVYFDVMLMNLK